jgi:hypothetical protein
MVSLVKRKQLYVTSYLQLGSNYGIVNEKSCTIHIPIVRLVYSSLVLGIKFRICSRAIIH